MLACVDEIADSRGTMTRYRSSISVPSEALARFKKRAQDLYLANLSLAKEIVALAREKGELPERLESADGSGTMSSFPFVLHEDLVEKWGGEERVRELLRWAIVEGLELSPLAPPKDVDQ